MPEKVAISNIDPGDRVREEYGDLEELAKSMKEFGQMQPIEIVRKEELEEFDRFDEPEDGFDEEKEFLLVSGGRRFFTADILLGWEEIKASMPEKQLNEVDYRERELEENLQRKELSWDEEVEAKDRLHRLKQKKYGPKMQGGADNEGWSQEDTAEVTGDSVATVSKDLSLAEDLKEFPEIKEEATTKSQAKSLADKKREQRNREKHAQEMREKEKEGKTEEEKEKLCNRYIVGDFFQVTEQLPKEQFDLIELDPPYGINFDAMVDGSFGRAPSNTVYTDIDESKVDQFMTETARRAYKLLKPESWLIFWMSGQYSERSRTWLEEAGFRLPNLPAIWNTLSGRCRNPKYNLAHDSEYFWYARKGAAQIPADQRGRSNIFTVRRVKHSARYHDNQAPISLYENIFKTFCSSGDAALSGFCGSGAAILAGHNVGVETIGIDIDADGKYKNSFESKVWDGELGSYDDE